MRESISYSFLLNTIILFIFVCFAVIMGIFSYYRAFRANTIIINSIEKYEGFNCLSQQEAENKLNTISYKTPFRANTRNDNDGELLTGTDEFNNIGYSVIYYDLDNRNYQYGIFTYMYMDLPIINRILRIPFYSKTRTMYEFRNLTEHKENGVTYIYDERKLFARTEALTAVYAKMISAHEGAYGKFNLDSILKSSRMKRKYEMFDTNNDGWIDARDAGNIFRGVTTDECGVIVDYSKY